MKLTSEIEVEFREETHQYFRNGKEYISQSKFMKLFEPVFDKAIVGRVAQANGISEKEQQRQWDNKRDGAAAHGNSIHKPMEDYWNGKPIDRKYMVLVDQVHTIIQPSRMVFPEKIFYLDPYEIAGTADLPSERCVLGGRQVLDIFDYKTNISKGITLYSSKLKNGKFQHYGNARFHEPIAHLEHTLYNKYALQLSLYMYMAEFCYGCSPGRMAILYINPGLTASVMPVPYLKYEIQAMLDFYKQLTPI